MSAIGAMSQWLRSLGQPGGIARGDLAGGVTAALVLPAIEGSYGMLALAPLGAEHAATGFLIGAFAAVVASAVSLAAGGRGPLLCGSNAALAVLVATLITWLLQDAYFIGPDGQPLLERLLAFVAAGVALAGLLQFALGRARLGGLVRYVPYPVHAGYMNGVALLMIAAVLPFAAGAPLGAGLPDWGELRPLAPLVALVALAIALRPPAWSRRVPAYLLALLVATGLHHLLALTPAAGALGPLFEPPQFEWPAVDTMAPLAAAARAGELAEHWALLVAFALAVAMMATLQTALAGATIGELTQRRRDGERETYAQGVANLAAGTLGALPGAASTTRSKLNIDAGGASGVSRLVFAAALLVALLLGLRFMSLVPTAAIAGVFAAVAVSLVDEWSRRATRVLWQQLARRRVPALLAQSYAVMALVAAVTVFVSLMLAIALGALVAMILFIRSNLKPPVRRVSRGDLRGSRKVRPAAEAAALRRHGSRIALLELDGALFFGTAEAAGDEIERAAAGADFVVLDFRRVADVDASGARALLRAVDQVRRAGGHLLLAGLAPADARTRTLHDMDLEGRLSQARFFADSDRALEHAEERLLAAVAPAAAAGGPLPLARTLLGEGLAADELAWLESQTVERRCERGEAVFRAGDPADSLFVSLQGRIEIRLPARAGEPGAGRRMVSYAPGVAFGEIGLLEGGVRSADAVAEDEAIVLELPRAHYDQLAADRPALLAKLLARLGALLSSRVRALTDELRDAEDSR